MKEGISYAIAVLFMLIFSSVAMYTPIFKFQKLELKMDSLVTAINQKDTLIKSMLITINRKDSSFREHMSECTFFSNKAIEMDGNRYLKLKHNFSLLKDMSAMD